MRWLMERSAKAISLDLDQNVLKEQFDLGFHCLSFFHILDRTSGSLIVLFKLEVQESENLQLTLSPLSL